MVGSAGDLLIFDWGWHRAGDPSRKIVGVSSASTDPWFRNHTLRFPKCPELSVEKV